MASTPKPYYAPVLPDYRVRDEDIAFYEARVRAAPRDQISAKLLASQYLQRYREEQDVGDILRAIHEAERSVALQPQNNETAKAIAAAGFTALHEFAKALSLERAAYRDRPDDANLPAQIASSEMELGRYADARRDLRNAKRIGDTPTVMAVEARYDELTGKLADARRLLNDAIAKSDGISDNSAQGRAWYHFRAGELAFEDGDIAAALTQERTALEQFPNFELAYRALARFCWAVKDWRCALDAATKGTAILPEPETLGYEADAQHELGLNAAAQETQHLIFAVERIGNVYRLNDRLLVVYYVEHGVHERDALNIARREAKVRGDEIYAQDTLAWAAAANGHWLEAARASALATRFGIEDERVNYHAAVIALHFGRKEATRRFLQRALSRNAPFHPLYRDRAKRMLQALSTRD